MTELTPEEKEYLTVLNDPVAWCEATLRDPEDPTKPLRFRPHQKKILSSQPYLTTNKYGERVYRRRLKVLRLARRSGKTVVMAAEAIYKAATNANFRILYVAPFECLTKSANVLMKDGSYRTIEELLTSWKGREVQSLDENMKLTNSSIVDMHWSGFRDVYRLQLDGGYEITSTDNHRYLTIDGWKELKDLKVGDFVAVPRRTTGEPIEGLDKNIARMLGYLISNGTTCGDIRFSHPEDFVIDDFKRCTSSFNNNLLYRVTRKGECWHVRVVFSDGSMGTLNNPLYEYIRSIGLFNKNAHEKFIPECVFHSSLDVIAELIKGLWVCDGTVSTQKRGLIYSSCNRKLIYQLQSLLLRFGIISSVTHHIYKKGRYKGKDIYQLAIYGADSLHNFSQSIGLIGKKATKLEELLQSNPTGFVFSRDIIPKEILPYVKRELGISLNKFFNFNSELKCGPNPHNMTREYFKYRLSNFNFNRDMYVGKIEDSDIYWKRIIDITHTGKEDTYDLEIDQTHTFIANNIIVHNSQSSIFFDMIDKMIGNTLIHPVSFRKKPYYIEFSNGSYIKGATANVRSSNKGDSIRGAEGDHICLAEGTRVMNDLGEYVPIETLANNVRIMGFDEDGPSIGNLISISHRKANCISIETPISEIVCTPDHPLFDGEKDVPACDAFEVVCDLGFLNSDRIGQVCRKLSKHYHHEITREDLKELWVGGTFYLLPILRRENVKGKKRVYTLRVSQDARHRYIANGCVVHNCLDEMDYGMDDVIEDVILPIFNGNNIATITGASTPTGERGIFYKWCFPKEMLISMPGGGRMIKDIRVGDQVIAADGSVDVVTKLFEQPYDGELYNFNISSLRIRCTPNHEFMTMDRGFVPASDLKLNDYVEIPKYMLDRNPEFPLKRFDSDYYRHPQTRIKHRTWNELVRKFTNQHNQLRFARMVCIYARWGRNIPERQVKSNADKGVQFFCRKNSPLGDELKASMEFFFGVTPELTEYQEHVQHVYRSVNAVKVFGALAPGKPTVIRLDPWILQEKFKSAIYEIYRDNSATKSPAMAMQLLTYSLNFPGDRMIVPVVGYRWCTPYWHIHHRLPFKFKDGKWYGIIKKIRVHQFNRPVYNFETEKTHTYTAGGVGVHNCTDKTQGVEEFHYDCWSNPKYTKESDNQIKKMVSATRYLREQLAEFGESLEGVFRHADMLQIIASYKYEDLVYNPKNMYIMGVDWNEKFGVSIVIVERSKNTGKYRIFRHIIIDKQELTQTVAVNKIIDIHTREFWCHAIYADLGYGVAQVQLLRQYGYEHPETKLHEIVKPIDYASKVEMLDPVSQKKVERPAKPAMVENAQLVVEAHDIQIPDCEDADYGIFGQMRCFKVNRMGMNGHPIYEGTFRGEDNDHSLNAMFLALLGFTLELQASEPVAVATYVKKIVAGSISVPQRESAIAASQGGALRDLLRRNAPNYRPAKQEKVFPVVMPRQIRIAKPFRRKTF